MPQSAAPSPTFTPSDAASGAGLARLALGFVVLMLVTTALIVLGALVRAHGAGLACPDWPLCFGRVIPEIDFEVAFEWSHRVLAGAVSLAFAALAFGVLRRPAARPAARPLPPPRGCRARAHSAASGDWPPEPPPPRTNAHGFRRDGSDRSSVPLPTRATPVAGRR